MIDLKNFQCECGIYFTVEARLNSIAHEHLEFCTKNGYMYKEAILKKDGNDLILCCPDCGKEAYRRIGGWINDLN